MSEIAFGYNKTSGRCKRFEYSGCGGNDNRYCTMDECRSVCGEYSNSFITTDNIRVHILVHVIIFVISLVTDWIAYAYVGLYCNPNHNIYLTIFMLSRGMPGIERDLGNYKCVMCFC